MARAAAVNSLFTGEVAAGGITAPAVSHTMTMLTGIDWPSGADDFAIQVGDDLEVDAEIVQVTRTAGLLTGSFTLNHSAGDPIYYLADANDLNAKIADPGGVDDDVLQRKSGGWTFRTLAQLWTDLTGVSRTFTAVMTFASRVKFNKGFGRSGFRCDASDEITLTLDAAVTTTGQTSWTIDSASATALAAIDLPATCRTPSGEKIIARTLVGVTLTVVRARFGTAASTYANGSTFSTHLAEDYLASSSGPSTILLANASASGNYYLPPRTTSSGITPPVDGQEFTFVDVTGTAGRLLGGAVLTIRSYQSSGTGPEWGNIDHPNGSITFRYNAADLTYSVIARNGVPEIMDGDSITALGPLRWYTGTGDPNGVYDPFGERAVYLDKAGGAGTTLWVNEDGTITGWVAK